MSGSLPPRGAIRGPSRLSTALEPEPTAQTGPHSGRSVPSVAMPAHAPFRPLPPSSSTVDNYHQRHQARRSVVQILLSEASARRSKGTVPCRSSAPQLVALLLLTPDRRARAAD